MTTHDSNQPPAPDRPKRRMVLRKIGETTPLPPRAARPSVASIPEMAAPAQPRAPRTARATLPPPAPQRRDPIDAEVPIPLTRLHTSRPRFRSAIDLPPHDPRGPIEAAEQGAVRESSTATLPPLVASLPPASPPLYLPGAAGSGGVPHGRVVAFWGALTAAALMAVVTGVAVGRRVAQGGEGATQHAVASREPLTNVAPGVPPWRVADVPGSAGNSPEKAVAVTAAPTPVEALPKVEASANRAVARPAVRVPPPATSGTAMAAAPTAARAAPAPAKSDDHGARAASGDETARAAENDTPSSNDGDESSSPALPAGQVAAPVRAADPPLDPLLKAIQDDIHEEQARRK